jgi:hypothetical protein
MEKTTTIHPSSLDLKTLLDLNETKKFFQTIMKADYERSWDHAAPESREKIEEDTKRRIALLDKIYREELKFPLDKETQEDINYLTLLLDTKEHRHKNYKLGYVNSQKGIDENDRAHAFAQEKIEQKEELLQQIEKARNCLNALIESMQIQAIKA